MAPDETHFFTRGPDCEMADCIGTGFPQLSCVLVHMRYSIGENGCGHILKGAGGSGGKKVEERTEGETAVGICKRQ